MNSPQSSEEAMQQFVVKKASGICEERWSTRVLTIDAAHHVLYLSQRDNVAAIDHHCMVHIRKVRWWPHYNWFLHSSSYSLVEAPCSFCVEGSTAQRGSSSVLSKCLRVCRRGMTEEEKDNYTRSVKGLLAASAAAKTSPCGRVKAKSTCESTWMLHCMSPADITPLLNALRLAVVDTERVRGDPFAPTILR